MTTIIINVQLFFLDAQFVANCIPQPLGFKISMPPSKKKEGFVAPFIFTDAYFTVCSLLQKMLLKTLLLSSM